MSEHARKLSRYVLWAEALYDAFPCRFTLWLWKRAADKYKAARNAGIVKLGKIKWPGASEFMGSVTSPAKPFRRAPTNTYDPMLAMQQASMAQQNNFAQYQNAANGQAGIGQANLSNLLNSALGTR